MNFNKLKNKRIIFAFIILWNGLGIVKYLVH